MCRMAPLHSPFFRRKPMPFVRWVVASIAAILLHLTAITLLFLWPSSSPQIPKTFQRQYVVQLQRNTIEEEPRSSPSSNRVSTENHTTPKETKMETPQHSPTPLARRRTPRRQSHVPSHVSVATTAVSDSIPESSPTAASASATKPSEPTSTPSQDAPSIKLFPTEEETQKILGITPEITPPDVATGSENAINSRKWIGASFFLRVREAVARSWNPEPVYRAHDPDGRVYGYKNWLTILTITLDAQGNLREPIIISQPSGLRFLDLEAMRAIREAAPFLNPPPEIVDASGRIKFRFGFLVEVNAGLNFRMFRF